MLVLAIDTSTPDITVGAVRLKQPLEVIAEIQAAASAVGVADTSGMPTGVTTQDLLAERVIADAFGHAEKLMPLITAVLAESGHTMQELDAIAVGIGPGPFTGLRVGMATAAALGDALDIPVHGVPSHDAMARAAWARAVQPPAESDVGEAGTANPNKHFVVVTDARRKEVYVSGYAPSLVREFGPAVVRPAELAGLLAQQQCTPSWATGAGAGLVAGALDLPVHTAAGSVAAALVECAAQVLLTGAIPGPLTPLYLRRPDAAEPTAPKPALPADEVAPHHR